MIAIKENEFKQLTEYIKKNYGVDLTHKKNLIEGRLSNYLIEKGFDNFSEYFNSVLTDRKGEELTVLINKLTTNYTFFMREVNHFDFFRDKILPNLAVNAKDKDLRLWSAGCSSGEEPYTLAMILSDYFQEGKALWDTKILATDISEKALGAAQKGIYSAEAVADIPASWKMRYFNKIDKENYEISDKLKKEVIFRIFNLMQENFSFRRKFHVIFCRNVMIYFDNKTKANLINRFYECTEPGGYLFIGHAESINREETSYKYVMPAVYRKI